MGILLCEQNFRDVWIRNKSVRAEIGQILRTHTHTTAAKLVVRMAVCLASSIFPGGASPLIAIYCMKAVAGFRDSNH